VLDKGKYLAMGRIFLVKGTRESLAVLALFWLALLITVAGTTSDTWYLMGIGILGRIQNIAAAGSSRTPEEAGIPLEFVDEISSPKVMKTLQECEERYPRVGACFLPIFFPGELRPDEALWWAQRGSKEPAQQEHTDMNSAIRSFATS